MNKQKVQITVSTPGRICLFGEHQDYLNLPVIPAAISLRMSIRGSRRNDSWIHIALPDVQEQVNIDLTQPIRYEKNRDYFRSALKVLQQSGFTFSSGFDCTVHGEIPIKAGTSSSSALSVSWVNFLAHMSDQSRQLSSESIGECAYKAEVVEFNEPGGMMDQYSTAMGGVIYLSSFPAISIERLQSFPGAFVLGDSHEPKDTMAILSRVKKGVLEIAAGLRKSFPGFSLQTISVEELASFHHHLNLQEQSLLKGTIRNRDITQEALEVLRQEHFDGKKFGALLNEHQQILRDVLQISTPKIDRMLEAAMLEGAYGGKINGSGGGGCMFVYAPEHHETIAEAIERAGGKAYVIHIGEGTRIESEEQTD